ncbi:hypothetical protein TRFO_15855 [Tritrichomonas foetus]|uniref:Surface antigen BspA-like n=1 Tax=Tritrichomonas foetus TaxID=1144522 RepID=A0A1J4KRH1_9EUKA|nr:hypothetical protein TRFO_15855 [Tritrichomonas foetus]|eukprot:OHT13851.1 hypothetical protein TRFO_15855 [Tritrichomonas foetus]
MTNAPRVRFAEHTRRRSMPDTFSLLQQAQPIEGVNYQLDGTTARIFRSTISTGDVTIPASVTHCGKTYIVTKLSNHAFEKSTITSLQFTSDSEVTSFGTSCIPDTLEELVIPAKLKELEYCFLGNAKNLTTVEVDPQNNYFTIHEGCLYNKGLTTLYIVPRNMEVLNLPTETIRINPYAASFSNLKTIVFPDDSQLKIIDNAAFSNTKLTEVTFPPSVNQLGNLCFGNVNLEKATFTGDSISIGKDCFTSEGDFTFFALEGSEVKQPKNASLNIVRIDSSGHPITTRFAQDGAKGPLEERIVVLEKENQELKKQLNEINKKLEDFEKKMAFLLESKNK